MGTAARAVTAAISPAPARRPVRQDSGLAQLAPAMRAAVEAAERACWAARLPVLRFETFRTRARQEWLYAQGREVKPPNRIVTNASSAIRSWHGFGLAVDFIHPKKFWDAPTQWWHDVAELVQPCGLAWGGLWATLPDVPHYQWAGCPLGPRAVDRADYTAGHLAAVWARYGADRALTPVP